MNFAPAKRQSLAEQARYAADTGSALPRPRPSLLSRARPVLIGIGAAGALAASALALQGVRGPAAPVAVRAEPVSTGSLAAAAPVPARRSSTPKKGGESAKPRPELAADLPREEAGPSRVAAMSEPELGRAAAGPEPERSRSAAAPLPAKSVDPGPSPAQLAEIEREAKEGRLARLAKREAARKARAAEAAAAERREKAALAAAAEARHEKARSRAVAERARAARTERTRAAAAAPSPGPRVAQARPRSGGGYRIGLLTPVGIIPLSGPSQRYSAYPGAPPR